MKDIPALRPPPSLPQRFVPAPKVLDFVREHIFDPGGELHNSDFLEISELSIGILWTDVRCGKSGQLVLGQCGLAEPMLGDRWARAKRKQQLDEWFDDDIDFVITLYAPFAQDADLPSILAVLEHELYHIGIAKWIKGKPILEVRRHDVEEFIGVIRRYGASASSQPIARLVEAATRQPEIGQATIEGICGSCGREVA